MEAARARSIAVIVRVLARGWIFKKLQGNGRVIWKFWGRRAEKFSKGGDGEEKGAQLWGGLGEKKERTKKKKKVARAVGCDDHTGRKNNASDEIVPAVRDISGFENTPVIYIYRVAYREKARAKKSFPPTRPVFTTNRAYEI